MLYFSSCFSRLHLGWHPGTPALIRIYVLEVVIFAVSGNSRLSVSMHVCVYVCLFAWLACQDIWLHLSPMEDYRKWQIKGLSLAAWQRTENYSRNRRCVRIRVSEYVRICLCACAHPPRRRPIPLAMKPITSVIPPKLSRVWCSPLTLLLLPLSSWEDDKVPLVLSGGGKEGNRERGRWESQRSGQADRRGWAEERE